MALERLKFKVDLVAEFNGKPVLNRSSATLLKLIHEQGSILSACRSLGIPYSNAWSLIARIERILGERLIEPTKGGRRRGGTRLTEIGRMLLKAYLSRLRELPETLKPEPKPSKPLRPDLLIAGSHEPLLESAIDEFKKLTGLRDVEFSWIGSAGGLASLMLDEADVAGVHLKDPETGEYNVPFLRKYWLDDKAVVFRGFRRLMVFTYKPSLVFKGVDEILEGEVRIVNRVLGSGTRLLLDQLLKRRAEELGIDPETIPSKVSGYGFKVKTHYELARSIIEDKGDVGLTLKYVADKYGLAYTPVCWENYDFVVRTSRLEREPVKKFIRFLKSRLLRSFISQVPGYELDKLTGEIVYKPRVGV